MHGRSCISQSTSPGLSGWKAVPSCLTMWAIFRWLIIFRFVNILWFLNFYGLSILRRSFSGFFLKTGKVFTAILSFYIREWRCFLWCPLSIPTGTCCARWNLSEIISLSGWSAFCIWRILPPISCQASMYLIPSQRIWRCCICRNLHTKSGPSDVHVPCTYPSSCPLCF